MSKPRETTDLVQYLVAAMKAGTIPYMDMTTGHGGVTAQVHTNWWGITPTMLEGHEKIMEAVRTIFPGGVDFVSVGRAQSMRFGGNGRRKYADAAQYDATYGETALRVVYLAPHECKLFHGSAAVDDGKAVVGWKCNSCGEAPTVTRQRELGLLPPLNRRKTGTA